VEPRLFISSLKPNCVPTLLRAAVILAVLCAITRKPVAAQTADTASGDAPIATLGDHDHAISLQNATLRAVIDGQSPKVMVTDKAAGGQVISLDNPFSLELKGIGILHARDLKPTGPATQQQLTPNPSASRLADPAGRFTAVWAITLRQGSPYIRQTLTITAGEQALPLTGIVLIDVKERGIVATGSVKGSPLVAGNFYLGFESPLSECSVMDDRGVCELSSGVPLNAHQSAAFSSVIGIAPPGQMRRAFLAYLERERAHPYRTFLHYNSWFDIGYFTPYTQQDALNRIHAFGEQLHVKRGVTLDSYLFDEGWDDTNNLWKIRPDFKDGFTPLTQAAAKYGAAPGVWLSPWGGYDPTKPRRIATAKRDGYEIVDGGLALSGPRYYKLFHDAVTGMVNNYGVNQFKLDGTGNVDQVVKGSAFSSDFDAAIHLISDVRRLKPDIYINLTTGTWPSPFWLFYADSIWRGGDDTEFAGVGTDRERWITYRDADTYSGIVKLGQLYPLNSLMLHGIVFAQKAPHLSTDPGHDFANEVRSYFGSGTQLQEMYITPSLLTNDDWDVLAESARWSRANAATLVDTHWIGGDPRWLEVYGWAAWSPQKAIITLRNPSNQPQDFTLDAGQALQLPPDAPRAYVMHSPWSADAAQPSVDLQAGTPHAFHLAPFEVLTLEGTPKQ
jgi:hypothetical protein